MALFEKVKIIDSQGREHVVTGNIIHKPLEVIQSSNGICIKKEDFLSINADTTCINLPNSIIRTS